MHYDSQDFNPTPGPTPKPETIPANNSTEASPSPPASPTPAPTILPTPLVSDVELVRPGFNIATLFAMLIGLACVGYIAYLSLVVIRK